MVATVWRLIFALLFLAGCGDRTEVKVADRKPAESVKETGKPVTGDWLIVNSALQPCVRFRPDDVAGRQNERATGRALSLPYTGPNRIRF